MYCIGADYNVILKDSNYTISNGPTWSLDNKILYHNDTAEGAIYAFDFDLETAEIKNKKLFYKFSSSQGLPDGMVTDSCGNLWVACARGGKIICLSPQAECLHSICMPVGFITSCVFAGEDFSSLFVTTSRFINAEQLRKQPQSGCLFHIDLSGIGVSGFALNCFRG